MYPSQPCINGFAAVTSRNLEGWAVACQSGTVATYSAGLIAACRRWREWTNRPPHWNHCSSSQSIVAGASPRSKLSSLAAKLAEPSRTIARRRKTRPFNTRGAWRKGRTLLFRRLNRVDDVRPFQQREVQCVCLGLRTGVSMLRT